jgi:hypothetical protein
VTERAATERPAVTGAPTAAPVAPPVPGGRATIVAPAKAVATTVGRLTEEIPDGVTPTVARLVRVTVDPHATEIVAPPPRDGNARPVVASGTVRPAAIGGPVTEGRRTTAVRRAVRSVVRRVVTTLVPRVVTTGARSVATIAAPLAERIARSRTIGDRHPVPAVATVSADRSAMDGPEPTAAPVAGRSDRGANGRRGRPATDVPRTVERTVAPTIVAVTDPDTTHLATDVPRADPPIDQRVRTEADRSIAERALSGAGPSIAVRAPSGAAPSIAVRALTGAGRPTGARVPIAVDVPNAGRTATRGRARGATTGSSGS